MDIGPYSFSQFKEMARQFHGFPAPGILIGGYMVELAKERLPEGTLFEAVVETGKCLPDAVQLLTPCSIGNGWMKIFYLGRYALALYDKYTGQGWRVYMDTEKLEQWPEIKSWFLKLKSKQEQDEQRLLEEIEQAGNSYFSLQSIEIAERYFQKKSMREISICPVCREAYPLQDGAICRGCQGDAPYLRNNHICLELAPGPDLKSVPLSKAAGQHALHDMTRIIPGKSKGPEFKAGQKITDQDLSKLQQMGRSSVYIVQDRDPGPEWVHENKAAEDFALCMAGKNVICGEPQEGKINFSSQIDGLLSIDLQELENFNLVPDVICSSRQNNLLVEKNKPFAGCRAIPLYLSRDIYTRALSTLKRPLFAILPLRPAKVGILVTGTEVFQGLVEDKFYPVIKAKVENFNCQVVISDLVPDESRKIAQSVQKMLEAGAELIITTAGLSVDPDDVTRKGLLQAGLENILYGIPVLPGAMSLLGNIGQTKVLGVPACALFAKTTSLDLLLPRLLAGQNITRKDMAKLAEGGFCLNCKSCTFPKCPFGK